MALTLPDVKIALAGFSPHMAFWFRAVPMACVEIVSSCTRASKLRGFRTRCKLKVARFLFVCLSVLRPDYGFRICELLDSPSPSAWKHAAA